LGKTEEGGSKRRDQIVAETMRLELQRDDRLKSADRKPV